MYTNAKPFTFNLSALRVVPVSVFNALTALDQVDALYEVADDPSTSRERATELAALAGRMLAKLAKK